MKYLLLIAVTTILVSCSGFLNKPKSALPSEKGPAKYDPDKPEKFANWYCDPKRLEPEIHQQTTIEEDNEIREEQAKLIIDRADCVNTFRENKYFEPSTLENP